MDSANGSADAEAAVDWQAFVPTDVADHLATMDRAARESNCGVPWQLLAAISRVESDFGRNMATSSAGAVGYGQFLPSSWQAYGNDGNVYDYRDALPAIATYLCQAGLERDPRTALFAYNHADWYVDLVLDLAVRYDRMAPGAPIPDVLGVGPADEHGLPLRYAPGRNVRLRAAARPLDASAWLGVPWQGRPAALAISFDTLETTCLAMLRATYGLTAPIPLQATGAGADELTDLANLAWQSGLLPLPIGLPTLHTAADRQPTLAQAVLAQIRRQLGLGRPVVALVDARFLPGHPPTDPDADQPLVVLGQTPDGLIVSDPSFSSSLGYGLEVKETEFVQAWAAATTPVQALAFTPRPQPLPREMHLREAEPPPVYARVVSTSTPSATPAGAQATVTVRPSDISQTMGTGDPAAGGVIPSRASWPAANVGPPQKPIDAANDAGLLPTLSPPGIGAPVHDAADSEVGVQAADDRSWLLVVASGALLCAALAIRQIRAHRPATPPDSISSCRDD